MPAAPAAGQIKEAPCPPGDRALARHDFETAKTEYEACLKNGPPSYETLSNLGIIYAQAGQFDQAIRSYQQALAMSPESPPLHLNLGLAFLKSGRPAEAATEFARALLFDPDNPQTEELLAVCHFQMNDYALAAVEAQRVRKARPDEPSAAFLLGSAYLKLNLYNQAIPLIDFALRKTNTAEAHAVLGQAYLGVKAYKQALEEFRAALGLDPKIRGLHDGLGTAYSGLGNTDLAVAEYEKELAGNANDFEATYYLGRLKRLGGQPEEAKKLLEKAEQLKPGDPSVGYEFAVFAIQEKDYPKALALLQKIVGEYPTYTDAHVLLSEVYYKLHRRDDGEREKAIVDRLKKEEQARQSAQGIPSRAGQGDSSPRPAPQ